MDKRETSGKLLDQRLPTRDGVSVAIDTEHPAVRRFKDRARITTAAECAVDIVLAILRREHLQHFVEHHGQMAAHGVPSASLAMARSRCWRRRAIVAAWI